MQILTPCPDEIDEGKLPHLIGQYNKLEDKEEKEGKVEINEKDAEKAAAREIFNATKNPGSFDSRSTSLLDLASNGHSLLSIPNLEGILDLLFLVNGKNM